MEVDEQGPSAPKVRIVPIQQEGVLTALAPLEVEADKDESPRDRLLGILDQVDALVEKLRRDAMRMEEEKESLLTTLDTIRNNDILAHLPHADQDEVLRYAELLGARCQTVEVSVRTERDSHQEEALHQVNGLIDRLVVEMRSDGEGSRTRCISFMNACAPHVDQGEIDQRFEMALLGCTADDQKRIRRRLQGLLTYMDAIVFRESN